MFYSTRRSILTLLFPLALKKWERGRFRSTSDSSSSSIVCERTTPLVIVGADANARNGLARGLGATLIAVAGRVAKKRAVLGAGGCLQRAGGGGRHTLGHVTRAGHGLARRGAEVASDALDLDSLLVGEAAVLGVAVVGGRVDLEAVLKLELERPGGCNTDGSRSSDEGEGELHDEGLDCYYFKVVRDCSLLSSIYFNDVEERCRGVAALELIRAYLCPVSFARKDLFSRLFRIGYVCSTFWLYS